MRENGFGVKADAVLPLFDVDRGVVNGDRLDRAESGAAEIAQFLAAANLGFLRRKPVAWIGARVVPPTCSDKAEPGQSGPFVEQVLRGEVGQAEVSPTRPPSLPGGASRERWPISSGPAARQCGLPDRRECPRSASR